MQTCASEVLQSYSLGTLLYSTLFTLRIGWVNPAFLDYANPDYQGNQLAN